MKKNVFKKIISVVLIFVASFAVSSQLLSCKDKNVQEIYTVEEFIKYTQEGVIRENGWKGDAYFKTLRLMEDLDFEGVKYTPTVLKGDLDGNGHSLNNIKITAYNGDFVGIFTSNSWAAYSKHGYIAKRNARVYNLTVNNLNVDFTGQGANVGGLFGVIHNEQDPTIENVTVKGVVSAMQTDNVGGIVGWCYGGMISDCTAEVDVIGKNNVGGIAGDTFIEEDNAGREADFLRCVNRGTVTGKENVGGIVGKRGTVKECTNYGEIVGDTRVGGIIGRTEDAVNNCENRGEVKGVAKNSDGYSYVGGIAGYSEASEMTVVKNLENHGNISAVGGAVGGLFGMCRVEISNCQNEGKISGESYAGGLVGILFMTMDKVGTVINCTVGGEITANNKAGGIIGGINVFWGTTRLITNTVSAKISASQNAGKFIGHSSTGVDEDYIDTNTFTGEVING